MAELVEAGGMVGTPEAIREFYDLIDCDPGEVRDASTGPRDCAHTRSERNPVRKPARRRKTRPGANAERTEAVPKQSGRTESELRDAAIERRIETFERRVIPWGKYRGRTWAEVPVGFVTWFAGLSDPKAPGAKALQVAVREYLDLKYGIRVGMLF